MLVSAAPIREDARAAVSIQAAASTAIAGLLRGPRRHGVVVAATRDLVAVQVDDDDGPALICVTGPGAVRLPCAMMTAEPPTPMPAGTPAEVGDGQLRLRDRRVTAARWWAARPCTVSDPALCTARAAAATRPDLSADLAAAAGRLALAVPVGRPGLDDAVRGLLGLGPGLTPAGDDVLAGALVALRATGSPAGDRLAAAVERARPFDRTTAVSAGLLACATRGLSVPQLAVLLVALGSPGGDVDAARRELVAVGHTSGAALYLGVVVALATDRSPTR